MNEVATIDPAEAEQFGKLAADWWNPKGSSAMLHKLNPPRLKYLRERIDAHWGCEPQDRHPLAGRAAIDVGCGAGLLTEPLARLGATVTGIDAAPENIAVARTHAEGQGLVIDYRAGELAALAGEGRRFDLVTSMEVIEHVADPFSFISALAAVLASGGLMILSTPNRTPLSRLAMITLGEGLGHIPKGTHDWNKFLTPDELEGLLKTAGLQVIDRRGLSFSPTTGFKLSDNLAMDYFVTAVSA
ncbi:MAG: bifunctional 2-polyprenyl-6-hydroxyphenol methylase/3-demethylubiquinol 3-O-methyltransferase UbiG [Sphingomonadaceae bacterium]